jgi:hypothetical protein
MPFDGPDRGDTRRQMEAALATFTVPRSLPNMASPQFYRSTTRRAGGHMPFDGADKGDTRRQQEAALAILQDVEAYLATPGKWIQGAWSDHGRHCVAGAVKLCGRRRKVRLSDNLARGYLCRALDRDGLSFISPEVFNDAAPDLGMVLRLVASAIEIVRAELAGEAVPVALRCLAIGAWYDARRCRDLGAPLPVLPPVSLYLLNHARA